jgi:hypothetical protein
VQDAFVIVLVVVLAGSVVGALWASLASASPYTQIGRGRLSLNDGEDRPAGRPAIAQAAAEREAEIRQMLEARNARRVARGELPVDVEIELAELLEMSARPPTAASDPELAAEIRDLVIARNARRARAGKPPLDVEEEVARQLRELT